MTNKIALGVSNESEKEINKKAGDGRAKKKYKWQVALASLWGR